MKPCMNKGCGIFKVCKGLGKHDCEDYTPIPTVSVPETELEELRGKGKFKTLRECMELRIRLKKAEELLVLLQIVDLSKGMRKKINKEVEHFLKGDSDDKA